MGTIIRMNEDQTIAAVRLENVTGEEIWSGVEVQTVETKRFKELNDERQENNGNSAPGKASHSH